MATKVVKNLKRTHSVEDICEVDGAKVCRREEDSHPETNEVKEGARSAFLREALKKIELLQNIIAHEDDDDEISDEDSAEEEEEIIDDQHAESLGYAMCARETISFLIGEGFPATSDLICALKQRLLGQMGGIPF
ncbi:hypothetical protein DMENIID0001_040970 [Sergentomyia squamirostris]